VNYKVQCKIAFVVEALIDEEEVRASIALPWNHQSTHAAVRRIPEPSSWAARRQRPGPVGLARQQTGEAARFSETAGRRLRDSVELFAWIVVSCRRICRASAVVHNEP
jgi:hypothetical protein